jgi:hypothetical protein
MENKYDKFIQNTYQGKELLKNYSLDDHGVWLVFGEDVNADYSGHHHSPFLGAFSGILRDVVAYAVDTPEFWSWGSGGSIKTATPEYIVQPITAESNEVRKNKQNKIEDAQQKIADLQAYITTLT